MSIMVHNGNFHLIQELRVEGLCVCVDVFLTKEALQLHVNFTLVPNLQVSISIIPPLSAAWLHHREVTKGLNFKLAKGTKY